MNTSCAMSLVQKRCPRRQFDCHRCAAKLQNSETVWELTVPTYQHWAYHDLKNFDVFLGENPFSVNSPGASPITFYSTYQKIPKKADGSLLNCNFEAENELSFTVPPGTSPSLSGWPEWAVDYDISRFTDMSPEAPYYIIDPELIPFYIPGKFDPPLPTWAQFERDHSALIHFLVPVIENGNVTTPGAWRIDLSVNQNAVYKRVIIEDQYGGFADLAAMNAFIDGLSPFDVFIADPDLLIVYVGHAESTSHTGSGTWSGVYKAPDNFTCPITPGQSYRFPNIIPYDLPPIKVDPIEPVIPEGYGQPKNIIGIGSVIYPLKPERDATFAGESFDQEDYFAPPYIDVKHVQLES